LDEEDINVPFGWLIWGFCSKALLECVMVTNEGLSREQQSKHVTFTVTPIFFSLMQAKARSKGLQVGPLIRIALAEWMERNK